MSQSFHSGSVGFRIGPWTNYISVSHSFLRTTGHWKKSSLVFPVGINVLLPFRTHEVVTWAPYAFPLPCLCFVHFSYSKGPLLRASHSHFHTAFSLSFAVMLGKESFAQRERVEIVKKLLPPPRTNGTLISCVRFFDQLWRRRKINDVGESRANNLVCTETENLSRK